jgi:hypothetical protein
MALETCEKQPWEKFFVAADYVNVLDSGETIVLGSSSVTIVDKAGADVTSTMFEGGSLQIAETSKLQCRIQAGTEAISPCKITFKAVTSLGNQFEHDFRIKIKDL